MPRPPQKVAPQDRRRVGSDAEFPPTLLERLIAVIKRWITTANAPVKVGVLVSLVGVGLLIREASIRGFVTLTIEMRLVAVAFFGLLLLSLGWRQRARQPAYGLSLQGGGIAVLYLTIFAAYARYDLLPAAVALVAVVAITVGAGALAVVQRSLSLALLGLIGGYLAPLLAYRWPEDHLAVFSFYAVLSVAVISVARLRSWPVLTLAGYGFTFAVSALWLADLPAGEDWALLQPFVAFFVLLYIAVPVISGARPTLDVRSLWIVPLVFGTPFIGIALQSMLVGHTEHGLLISALVLAAVHAVLYVIVRRWGDDGRMLAESYAALAVAFVAIAVPLAFDAYAWATAWVAQGVLLVWLGTRWRRLTPIVGGIALQLSAAAVYAYYLTSDGVADVLTADLLHFWIDTTPLLNRYFLGALLFAICGLISAWRLLRGSESMRIDPAAAWAALAWGGAWWFFAAFAEAYARLDGARLPAMSLIATLTLGATAVGARMTRWPGLDAAGLVMLPVLGSWLGLAIAVETHPVAGFGWVAWPIALAVYVAYVRVCEAAWPDFGTALHCGGYWAVAVLVGVETYWRIDLVADGTWPQSAALGVLLLMVMGTLGGRRVAAWPLRAHWRRYLTSCAAPVLGFVVLAAFGAAVASPGSPEPLPYLPVLNPVELTAIATALTALWWRELLMAESAPAGTESDSPLDNLVRLSWGPVLAGAGTVAATMALARTIHHWRDVPFELRPLITSTELQAALSILWAVIALAAMVAGVVRANRGIWIAGAAWMALVVAKLFLVDLASLTALSRVISFIGVGVLLLIVGRFAPVVPAAKSESSKD